MGGGKPQSDWKVPAEVAEVCMQDDAGAPAAHRTMATLYVVTGCTSARSAVT